MAYCNTTGSVAGISEMVVQPKYPHYILGAQFVSPKKVASQRCKTSHKRRNLSLQYEPAVKQPYTSTNATHEPAADNDTINSEVYSTQVGETLLTDYCLYELPTETISSCDYHDDNTCCGWCLQFYFSNCPC